MPQKISGHFALADAQSYLTQHETAGFVTSQALADSRIQSSDKRGKCVRAAGYLYASGWMEGLRTPMCGYVSDYEFAQMNAKAAYRTCQAVGIAPAFWLFSLVARHFLLPFLINLIIHHLTNEENKS
jgi:hypothetical protein